MDDEKLCCASCIGDRGLRKQIIPIYSTIVGTCSYCNTTNENLIKPSDLRNYFELLINIYSLDEKGSILVDWFKEDWGLFSHSVMDIAHSKELLIDILDDDQIILKNFIPSELCNTDRLAVWEEFRKELMHKNRYFPQVKINEDRFQGLLSHLLLDDGQMTNWCRARIQESDEVYPIEEMGAPAKRKASQGRANPAGIPYLYLASTPETAISEVRPHTGEFASVADFTIPVNLKFVDLRNPIETVSPFLLGDENEVALLRGDIKFLIQLGNELTRPVLPHAAAIDYIPSQYLCEFIKKCGYHGVIYKSSVGNGINLALFDPNYAEVGNVSGYQVSRVSVELKLLKVID